MSEKMTVTDCESALSARMPVCDYSLERLSEDSIVDNFFTNGLLAVKIFLQDYLVLPPKQNFLDGFKRLITPIIAGLSIGMIPKAILMKGLMIGADMAYDLIAKERGQVV